MLGKLLMRTIKFMMVPVAATAAVWIVTWLLLRQPEVQRRVIELRWVTHAAIKSVD